MKIPEANNRLIVNFDVISSLLVVRLRSGSREEGGSGGIGRTDSIRSIRWHVRFDADLASVQA